MRTSPILLLALVATGCTATKASIQLVSAEQAVVRARSYGADRTAEYEYTMAIRYLEKAREEAGYSEFRIADALARQSAEWSDRAIIFTERRGKTDFDLNDFQNAPEAPPAPEGEVAPPEPDVAPPPIPGETIPIPGETPPAEGEGDILEELFGEEGGTPAPAPEPKPEQGDFEMDDDLEIPK